MRVVIKKYIRQSSEGGGADIADKINKGPPPPQ